MLVGMLLRIDLYQFWKRIVGLVKKERLVRSCKGVLILRLVERTCRVLKFWCVFLQKISFRFLASFLVLYFGV